MNILQCEQDGDKLYSYDLYGQRILIGRTESSYKDLYDSALEATSKAEEYFNELVAHGLRVKAKSQEEINQELLAQNKQLQEQLAAVLGEIQSLKGGVNEHSEDETISQSVRAKK